ncbi:phosphatidylglycerophosphatase A [Paenibacillus chitinolyticus]|uniref:phosphatidylglycerophosphatase A family protein n=1 Tax=Paenibacillus chitinolyticus TaxID=79263 RepID=UPI002DBA675E|nr:phosphatidylglycerophosphatase A [Paenibacillus chitinolyticus]MEC0247783.1 phosphatidylglycerophosphatase A [Paenibacillus chitinolyticus]
MSTELVLQMLRERGVTAESVAEIVLRLQKPYNKALTIEVCLESVMTVLAKREVQYTLMTGIALDELAERRLLPEPLQSILEADEPLYGVDETLALGIVHVYGMIGLTSFGYLDKQKIGVIRDLNDHEREIHVFLDDLVAGLAAAASARIAHQNQPVSTYFEKLCETGEAGADTKEPA